jgi:hypothetical protein
VVASSNPRLLRLFKSLVLQEWEQRAASGSDDTLATIDCLELQKLKATLDLLIPGGEDDGQPEG